MNRSAVVTMLLAAALPAQQFEIALPKDPLDQKPIEWNSDCTAGDVDGDGRPDLLAVGPRLWLNRGSHFVAAPNGLPNTPFASPPTLFDADGDGDLDIVDAAAGVRLFQNQGTGTFADVTATHVPPQAFTIGSAYPADIDGDGDLDVLLTLGTVLVNDGLGVFTDETATRVLGGQLSISQAMAIADFDHDGDLDFVTGAGMHRNDGTGVFQFDATANITFGYPEHVFTADVDCDGHVDVVTSTARFLRNVGNGTFRAGPSLLPPASPLFVAAVADFDGDGHADLVSTPDAPANGARPMWCANDGSGNFAVASFLPLPLPPEPIRVLRPADLDGDGDLDLAANRAWSYTPAQIELLYNDGAGAWHSATDTAWPPVLYGGGCHAGDFDGDGDDDVFHSGGIHYNDGAGTFHSVSHGPATYLLPAGDPADLDGDGDLDVVSTAGVVWRNDGSGAFTNGGTLLAPPLQARDSAATDVDADGDLDLVLVTDSDVRVYRNDGGAVATLLPGVLPAGLVARAVTSGDFDGDGDADLVFGRHGILWPLGQTALLFTNDGGSAFTAAPMPAWSWAITGLHTVDSDGDGDLDVIAESPNVATVFVNGGAANFTAVALPMLPWPLRLDDIDGDGDVDVFATASQQAAEWFGVYVNDGANHFAQDPTRVDPARNPHQALEFTPVDFEGDGDRDVLLIARDTGNQFLYAVPYWNHQRQLRAAHLTTLGGELELELATTGAANPAAIAFVCIAAAPAHVDLGALGVLGVDVATGVVDAVLLSPGPAPTIASYPIPLVNTLRGAPLHVQALFVSSTQWRLSGTVVNTIVH